MAIASTPEKALMRFLYLLCADKNKLCKYNAAVKSLRDYDIGDRYGFSELSHIQTKSRVLMQLVGLSLIRYQPSTDLIELTSLGKSFASQINFTDEFEETLKHFLA